MSTSRPFAYNTGTTISGTEQLGNLAIGVPTNGFDSTGLQWFNGPDEDLGYVIAYPQSGNTQPTPNGGFANVQFWRSKLLTNQDFLNLCNSVIKTQTFNDTTVAKTYLNSNGYWTSFVDVTPTPTPSVTPTPTLTPTSTITPTPSITPTNTVTPTITPSITPTNTVTPTITPTITPTPSTTPPESSAVTFSQTFTNGQSPSEAIETAWTTFRGQLTGTYNTMSLSNNLGNSITVTDPLVQNIANALRTATTNTDTVVTIGVNGWRVAQGCVSGTATAESIYLTTGSLCSCGGTYTVRPMIKNNNWGGLNGSSCNQPTQTITLTFS